MAPVFGLMSITACVRLIVVTCGFHYVDAAGRVAENNLRGSRVGQKTVCGTLSTACWIQLIQILLRQMRPRTCL